MSRPNLALRCLSVFLTFLFVVLMVCGALAAVLIRFTGENGLYMRAAESLRDTEVAAIHLEIDALAEKWGFDAPSLKKLFSAGALRNYDLRVIHWMEGFLEDEPDLDVPSFYVEGVEDLIRSDSGFLSRVPESDQRSVARNDIEAYLGGKVQSMLFPIRGQLLVAARREVLERVSLETLRGLLGRWWIPFASSALCVLLLFLANLGHFRYFRGYLGSGMTVMGWALVLLCVLVYFLHLPHSFAMANMHAVRFVEALEGSVFRFLMWWIVPGLVLGHMLMLWEGKRETT